MIELEQENGVFMLRMVVGENRIGPEFLSRFNEALDEVERTEGPTALVTTGMDRFYSTGLDLEVLLTAPQA